MHVMNSRKARDANSTRLCWLSLFRDSAIRIKKIRQPDEKSKNHHLSFFLPCSSDSPETRYYLPLAPLFFSLRVRMSGFLFCCRPHRRNGEECSRLLDAKCDMHINR